MPPLNAVGIHVMKAVEDVNYHDNLTGLPSRTLFMDRLNQVLTASRRSHKHGALVFVDIDQLKHINNVHGHDVGDAIIKIMAERMRHALRVTDTVARFGGDEFLVLLPDVGATPECATRVATTVAYKLLDAILQECVVDEHTFVVSASLGVIIFPKDGESAADLVRRAGMAMHRAKELGKNIVVVYEPEIQAAVTQRYIMEKSLRRAIQEGGIDIHLHSQVDAQGNIYGAEILLRWNSLEHGIVPPSRFIPLAEDSGLVVPLGKLVLRKGCEIIRRIAQCGVKRLISVNVSPRQFSEPDFVSQVRQILDETGADPSMLMLEITENTLIKHPHETADRMRELAEIGVRFSIDDFGTGYSSLSYLKRMPLAELKIDKSFVQDAPYDANDAVLVEAILSMARHLGLEVVAEGVETEAQANFLVERGCKRFQGYYWYHPMPAEEWLGRYV